MRILTAILLHGGRDSRISVGCHFLPACFFFFFYPPPPIQKPSGPYCQELWPIENQRIQPFPLSSSFFFFFWVCFVSSRTRTPALLGPKQSSLFDFHVEFNGWNILRNRGSPCMFSTSSSEDPKLACSLLANSIILNPESGGAQRGVTALRYRALV